MIGNIAEVIIGLTLLIWGADRFVHGAAAIARNLGVAPLMIGLTIVAFATSAPEILVSIVAALRDEPDLAVGNALGSNIANIGLVLGATALIRPIELKSATLRREMVGEGMLVRTRDGSEYRRVEQRPGPTERALKPRSWNWPRPPRK